MFFSTISPNNSIAIGFGKYLLISDAQSGLFATRTFGASIVALAFAPPSFDSSKPGYFVVSTDDKSLYVITFNANGNTAASLSTSTTMSSSSSSPPSLDILGETKTPRRSHSLCAMFLPPSNDSVIVAGDKVGDVWVFPLPDVASKKRHVLTHTASIITAVTGGGGGGGGKRSHKYLVSADRDEKLRVSSWPRCYNVESYCLGHTRFVSTLCAVTNPSPLLGSSIDGKELMLSGGGDGALRLWNLSSGRLLHTLYLRRRLSSTSITSSSSSKGESGVGGAGDIQVDGAAEFSYEYTAEVSVGAHSDGDMVDATADGEGGGGDSGTAVADGEDDEDDEVVITATTTPTPTTSAIATVEEVVRIEEGKEVDDRMMGEASSSSSERKTPIAPAVIPLSLVELSFNSFAVFVEGEGAVRIISLSSDDEEEAIHRKGGGGDYSSSFQPRLSQQGIIVLGGKARPQTLGVIHLDKTSSTSSSSTPPSPLLLVGTVEEDVSGKILRQLRIFTQTTNSISSTSSSSSSSSWVAPILSSAATQEWARRVANLNTELTRIAALNEKDDHALFSNLLTANVAEYDKSEHSANASW